MTGALTSGSGINADAELTVGKKEEEIVTEVGGERNNIEAETVTYEDNAPGWLVLLACIGWLAPGPGPIFRGLLELLRTVLPWTKHN